MYSETRAPNSGETLLGVEQAGLAALLSLRRTASQRYSQHIFMMMSKISHSWGGRDEGPEAMDSPSQRGLWATGSPGHPPQGPHRAGFGHGVLCRCAQLCPLHPCYTAGPLTWSQKQQSWVSSWMGPLMVLMDTGPP